YNKVVLPDLKLAHTGKGAVQGNITDWKTHYSILKNHVITLAQHRKKPHMAHPLLLMAYAVDTTVVPQIWMSLVSQRNSPIKHHVNTTKCLARIMENIDASMAYEHESKFLCTKNGLTSSWPYKV
ncbi:hypothetical protein ACJX0J_037732, partial [Zea mays]